MSILLLKSEQGEMIHQLLLVFLNCCGQAADKGQPSITASHRWVSVPGSVPLLVSTTLAQPRWAGAHRPARCRAAVSVGPLTQRGTQTQTNTHPHPKPKHQQYFSSGTRPSRYPSQRVSDRGRLSSLLVTDGISTEAEGWRRVWAEAKVSLA